MLSIEKKIDLLLYKVKLLESMVSCDDEYPFFMFVLRHDFSEEQVKAIIKILTAFSYRLHENKNESLRLVNQGKSDNRIFLADIGIDVESLYSVKIPSLQEFEVYAKTVFSDKIEVKHLLMSLHNQSIVKDGCAYLLKQYKTKN